MTNETKRRFIPRAAVDVALRAKTRVEQMPTSDSELVAIGAMRDRLFTRAAGGDCHARAQMKVLDRVLAEESRQRRSDIGSGCGSAQSSGSGS